jgi:hypothetical protein
MNDEVTTYDLSDFFEVTGMTPEEAELDIERIRAEACAKQRYADALEAEVEKRKQQTEEAIALLVESEFDEEEARAIPVDELLIIAETIRRGVKAIADAMLRDADVPPKVM